jgi:hypothetical protein
MNTPDTTEELFTEWVNENQDKIRFAAWLKNLTEQEVAEFQEKFSRREE